MGVSGRTAILLNVYYRNEHGTCVDIKLRDMETTCIVSGDGVDLVQAIKALAGDQ